MNGNVHVRAKGSCPAELSETQRSFGPPHRNKKLNTRANLMEKFLWQEFFDEYNRQNSVQVDLGANTTEYFDHYCKDKPTEDEERKEVRINKYPVYCTSAITIWNHEGDVTNTFKKKYSITRPVSECTEKFAY